MFHPDARREKGLCIVFSSIDGSDVWLTGKTQYIRVAGGRLEREQKLQLPTA